jgi:asparagine synthase (glutamine-hydrolysing)
MCGIVGYLHEGDADEGLIRQMLAMIRHRGPDEFGLYLSSRIAMGNARLSIIDLAGGSQPISNEDESLWIVYNGEVFNYPELRSELLARGHRFSTHTDTEVILHLYEEYGPECLQRLNGQFAIAIWDERKASLFLARDRLGVRPLFYTFAGDAVVFGSEIKAVACHPSVHLEIDPVAMGQVFTYWSPLSPGTIFRNIRELPPGSYAIAAEGRFTVTKYWEPAFPLNGDHPKSEDELTEAFRELLIDAVRIRLRADVPVGAYLSGGLDSSVIASIVRQYGSSRLDTFSISFGDRSFDESAYQQRMAAHLGTDHQVTHATYADIGRVFPEVVWHTETPVLRTAPAPMFLLSQLVRESGYKVVLTGEGADEFLAGYDIFKEAKVRRFWAQQPESGLRPKLLGRLYGDIPRFSSAGSAFATAFFREGLTDVDAPDYSHRIRWRNTRRTHRFFSNDLEREIGKAGSSREPDYPAEMSAWDALAKSQYLEITTFLSPYLLSSQGDRMAMAHSVEGRFPFLDYRVVEFCNRLPASLKLRVLNDKYLLRKTAKDWLPSEIWQRPKRPYRAPIHRSFFNEQTEDYVQDLLSPAALKNSGLFKPLAVAQLVKKIEQGLPVGETDDMALAGILSSQLLHRMFVQDFRMADPASITAKARRAQRSAK